jgi:O-antigen/teichoic acid export membrane protein
MQEQPHFEYQEKELPRWIQVSAGLVLAVFTLLCAFAALEFLLLAPKPTAVLGIVAVSILVLGCLLVLAKCFRLVTGRKHNGGLLGPTMLRVVSIFLLVIPVAGLFTGYYREMGALAIFQAVVYFFGFLGLRALARKREARESQPNEPKNDRR